MGVTYKDVVIIGFGAQVKAKGDRKIRVYSKGETITLEKKLAERLHL
jgi:hypothetical protein